MKLKITKIDNLKTDIIHDDSAIITRDKNKLIVESKNIKCEFEKNGMYLLRKTHESTTEGLFNLLSRTRMSVETEYGQTLFDVKTLKYEYNDSDIDLKYELYSNSQLVDTFHFHFLLKREDGIEGYA
ncbi:MAG TPA: DUF1934 family protein [Erysipelothrix sp.]|jgi:hypothetical protein|nr:DUF1934 family protein [Erysipelothrix sp.]